MSSSTSTHASSAVSSNTPSAAAASSSFAASVSSSIAQSVSSVVQAGSTTTVEPSTTNVYTSTVVGSSAPATTNIITSVVTQSATRSGQTETGPVTVIVTSVGSDSTTVITPAAGGSSSGTSSATSSTSSAASLSNGNNTGSGGTSSGLSTAGKVAIAVVVPVAAVALLVLAGILLWRKRKQKREQLEQRRKDIADYGYNPNNDPTIPAVAAGGSEMAEENTSGYRGWGASGAAASNRKQSTTLSGGHTQGQLSDSGNSYGHSANSPGAGGSDGHSGDPLVNQRETMGSDDLAALGAAPAASSNPGVRRGPSNASSAYSNAARSDHSDELPPIPSSYDHNGNSFGE